MYCSRIVTTNWNHPATIRDTVPKIAGQAGIARRRHRRLISAGLSWGDQTRSTPRKLECLGRKSPMAQQHFRRLQVPQN